MIILNDDDMLSYIENKKENVVFITTPTCSKCKSFLNEYESKLKTTCIYSFNPSSSSVVIRDYLSSLPIMQVPATIKNNMSIYWPTSSLSEKEELFEYLNQ